MCINLYVMVMGNKICLITEIPSHYRKLIYKKLSQDLGCEFLVGNSRGTIKRIEDYELHMTELKIIYVGISNFYYVKGAMHYTSKFNIIINDLGIYCLSSWLLLIKAKFTKQKIYHWDHGWYGRESFIKKWLKRLYFGLSTGAFIYGDRAIKLMKENGFNEKKLYPIHNSLNYDIHIDLRKKISNTNIYKDFFSNNNHVLIFIGRLTKVKRLDMLIKAVSLLKENGEIYNLVFVGSGKLQPSLEELANKLNLSKQVWFYGDCYNEIRNAELIYNADLCISPGNIGLTVIHAMTFGCPCISHNDFSQQMPEFEAIHEGVTGSFYEHNNVESLASCISHWFKVNLNNREKIRMACYKEVDNNWNPYYQMKIIKQVINYK